MPSKARPPGIHQGGQCLKVESGFDLLPYELTFESDGVLIVFPCFVDLAKSCVGDALVRHRDSQVVLHRHMDPFKDGPGPGKQLEGLPTERFGAITHESDARCAWG